MIEVLAAVVATIVPAVALAACVRRWFDPVPWWVVAGGLALTLAFVAPGLDPESLPVPVDEVSRGYPHRGVVGENVPRNGITNDTVKLFYPWLHSAREALAAGELPLWNRSVFSGYPLLGNAESAPFSPFFLVTLFVPLARQVVAMAALKIFVAFLFAWLYCRRHGVSVAAALFAAVAFALSVYQVVYLYYSAATVSALLPAAIYAASASVETRSRRYLALFAIVVATLMLAGHPESVLHVAIGCAVALAIEFALCGRRGAWWRGFLAASVAAAIGLALSAPGWFPVLEQVGESARLQEVRSHRVMTEPFDHDAAWALVNPDGFGNPARGTWSWIYNYPVVASSYAGLSALVLLVVALTVRGRPAAWAACAIGTFLVSMNWSPLGLLNSVPPMSLVANDKMRFVAVFLAACAGAAAIDQLHRRRAAVLVASVAALSAWAMVYVKFEGRHFDAWPLAAALGVGAITVCAQLPLRRFLPAVAVVAIIADLFAYNFVYNARAPRAHYAPVLPIVAAARASAPPEPFRITGLDWTFLPNTPTLYGLDDIRGSDPMAWAPYIDVLRLISVDTPGADVRRVVDLSSPLLDFLNVRYAFCPPGTAASGRWALAYDGPDGVLLENTMALRRFFVPDRLRSGTFNATTDLRRDAFLAGATGDLGNGKARIGTITEGLRHLEAVVDATTPSLVVASTPALSGWRATVNGERVPIERVNGAFIGVRVPAGKSTLRLSYLPASFVAGCVVSVIAAIASAVLMTRRAK